MRVLLFLQRFDGVLLRIIESQDVRVVEDAADADVTAGLDAYEPTYEMVRSALPPRRRPGEPV